MFKELITGFDCREMWIPEAEVKNWEDKSWLLNPNVERILSINKGVWHSVFVPSNGKNSLAAQTETLPNYNLTIPLEWITSNNYWHDLGAMREFITQHKEEYKKRCWMIGITIVQTPEYILGIKAGTVKVLPTEEKAPDTEWKLLGYDVEDSVFFNGGLGMSWIEEYESERRKLWGNRLNQYYLFSRQEDASEYASWHNSLNTGIGTLLIFGLYFIQEIPSND